MTPLYFIKTIFWTNEALGTRKKHITFVERDEQDMNFESTVQDIMDGQVTDVVQVLCIQKYDGEVGYVTGFCSNATREVAEKILSRLDHEPAGSLMDFLEHALGTYRVQEWLQEMNSGRSEFAEHNTLHRAAQGV